jgi:hypothetical protein
MMICVVGIASTLVVFDRSRELTTVSQKREAAVQQAERELERIISRPWASVAHPSPGQLPARVTRPGHPSNDVSGSQYRWNPDASSRETLIGAPGGAVSHLPTRWQDVGGRASGEVYRYVTESATRPNVRRITVAVTVAGPDAPKRHIRLSSLVTNPSPVL